MASVHVPDQHRHIADRQEMTRFLREHGIRYERWEVDDRVSPDAPAEDILAAYAPEIDRLKAEGGYVTADVIDVSAATPNLETMLDRFRMEHTHAEDEVRFILRGRGLFYIHPPATPIFSILVEAGDLISVPMGTQHWFDLCAERTIRAIRLFQDKTGWTPHYVSDPVNAQYEPVCFGPTHVTGKAAAR
jgi:1,2-dihydroxy-3-keto-5-methylthiopentene dioxygenase